MRTRTVVLRLFALVMTMTTTLALITHAQTTLVNDPPDQPALIQPADNGTDIGTSPVLQVAVSDPDASDVMDLSFYGRQAGATTASPDFTIVIIPDAQNLATSYPSIYTGQTQWIVDNKISANVAFVTSVGDLVNTSSSSTEYTRADAAFDILDAGNLPYSVSPGNHDMGSGSLWPTYFGTSRISGKSWYGGSYDNYNTYSLFSASGNDFILINLQYSPGAAVLNWADALLKANISRRGIIVQHDILNIDNSWNNQASYTALKDNPNMAMMLCGHMHSGSDGAAYRGEQGDDGHTIHIIEADYQDFGDDGYLRILRFSPSEDMIYMTTYSPSMGSYLTSTTNYDQANLVYDLANGTSAPFTLIGTAEDVTNGANTSTTWSDLTANTHYEWYASASDGTLSTNGPVWSFTTGANVVNYTLTTNEVGNGSVNLVPSNSSYPSGTIVTLTPVPDPGWSFNGWSGDLTGSANPALVTMDANKSITATFTQNQYTLTVNTTGSGSIVKSPDQPTFTYGDVVTLNAVPASGNTFDSWNGDLSGTANPATITISGNNTVTATFAEYTPVSLGVEGSASKGTADDVSEISFPHNTGTNPDRLMLVGLSWNSATTATSITSVTFIYGSTVLTLDPVITNQAGTNYRYAAIYSLLNPPSGISGTVKAIFSASISNGIVAGAVNFAGVNQTTPLGTSVGTNGSSTAPSVTLTGLTGNELVFDNVFQGASASSQTLTPGANQTQLWNDYAGNTRAASSAKPAAPASVTMSWTAFTSSIWAIAAVPINPAFIIPNYDLTMTVTGTGTITPAPGIHAYPQGTVVDISAVPADGFQFVNWTGDVADANSASTTVTMDATKTVTANFALEEYSLTVNTSGSGSVNLSPMQTSYHNGDVVSLTAIPSAGNTFDGWSGSLGGNPNPTTITINGNMSITANFSEYIQVPLASDGSFSSSAADDVSTIQIPITTGTGSDRLMLVGVSWNCGTADQIISSVSFTPDNGIATSLTGVINQQAGTQLRYSAIYSLLNPPRNTSGIVTITFSGVITNGIFGGAANFMGVNQSTPLGIAGGAGSTSQGTEPTVTLTGLNGNELVFDNVFLGASDETQTLTVGNNQTQLWNAFVGNVRAASSTEQSSSASITMSWTASTTAYWAIAAVPINPAITVINHNLTMAVNGNGTITPAAGTYAYAEGTMVDITAVPAVGYQFVDWTGEVDNVTSAITTVTMDASKTVTANFIAMNSIRVTSPNGGEIWQVGSSHDITWTTTGTIGDVNLAYSTDGSVWTDIIAGTGNTGTYSWTIPAGLAAGSTYMIRVSETDGEPWDISNAAFTLLIASVNQEINLLQGWNIFSLYVMPENENMLALVQPLIDDGSLVKVQNQTGDAIERDTDNEWFNDIGDWNSSEGYKIKVNAGTMLTVTGTPITDPVTIELESGWNIISYPVSNSYDAMGIMNSLIVSDHLTKVQDEAGDAIERDLDGEWFNDIGSFDPDEGYKVRLSADDVLSINPALYGSGSTLKSTKGQSFPSTLKSLSAAHFRPIWAGNGLDQMNIYITLASDGQSSFEPGDELGIFDGPNCVGSGIIRNTGATMQSFVVSADDPTTDEIDGFVAGNRISLKIWRPATNAEAVITDPEFMSKSSKVFESMGTSIININMANAYLNPFFEKKTSLGDIYPNPFNQLATIPFTIAEESYVDIAIYNVLGERVNTLVHGTLSVGDHTTVWDATNAGNVGAMPGLYFCKMIVKNEVFVKRIELIDHQ